MVAGYINLHHGRQTEGYLISILNLQANAMKMLCWNFSMSICYEF